MTRAPGPNSTIQQARDWINQEAVNQGGVVCPCCTQLVRVYRRVINHAQATTLILLHRVFPVGAIVNVNDFVLSLPNYLSMKLLKNREWTRVKYWGLLEEVQVTPSLKEKYTTKYPSERRSKISLHRLTDQGLAFVQGAQVYKTIYVFDDRVLSWDQDVVTVHDALGEHFDYNELMSAPVPGTHVGRIV